MRNYLDPNMLSRLESMELRARVIVEGALVGIHRSPYHGFSTEFKDHRNYQAGDELKRVDWKVYARSQKFYTKQFEEETNLNAYIILDSSASMGYKSETFSGRKTRKKNINEKGISKFVYASYLSAALAWLLIHQKDAVGFATFDEKLNTFIPPSSTRAHLSKLMKILDESKPSSNTKMLSPVDMILPQIKKKSMVIILSDLLMDEDEVVRAVRNIIARGNEVIMFHILDEAEYNFSMDESVILKDVETQAEISINPQIKSFYKKELDKCIGIYKQKLRSKNSDYILVRTSEPLDKILLYYLSKRL